jgi:hypothetical protein
VYQSYLSIWCSIDNLLPTYTWKMKIFIGKQAKTISLQRNYSWETFVLTVFPEVKRCCWLVSLTTGSPSYVFVISLQKKLNKVNTFCIPLSIIYLAFTVVFLKKIPPYNKKWKGWKLDLQNRFENPWSPRQKAKFYTQIRFGSGSNFHSTSTGTSLTFSWTSNGKDLLLFEITPKETLQRSPCCSLR